MTENESITFETIRKVQIEEKTFSKLSKLPQNFYSSVSEYLERKKRMVEGRKDAELKSIERIVEDIFDRRERKILTSSLTTARTRVPPENITEEEEGIFNEVTQIVTRRREEMLRGIFGRNSEKKMVKVVFKEDVAGFVGSDMGTYGPFKANETAEIPDENFKILSDRNVVEEMK